jgi:hypothetical protein
LPSAQIFSSAPCYQTPSVSGPESRSGCHEIEKNLLPLPGIKPQLSIL